MTRIGRGGFAKRCEYTKQNVPNGPIVRTIDLYRGVHTVSVYEARSGRKLAESRVEGEGFIGNVMKEEVDSCQSFLRTTKDAPSHSEQEGAPTMSQLRAIFEPHVRRAS